MHDMPTSDFVILLVSVTVAMLACRVIPLFLLKGRKLPESVERALGFIPPAAFAALVANDLLTPGMFDAGLWPAAAPLVSALVVAAVAVKTKSLLWSAIVGVVVYGLLSMI